MSGGHVGRARRLARDPEARERRDTVLRLPLAAVRHDRAWAASDALVAGAEGEAKEASDARDERETDELRTALGGGAGALSAAELAVMTECARGRLQRSPTQ